MTYFAISVAKRGDKKTGYKRHRDPAMSRNTQTNSSISLFHLYIIHAANWAFANQYACSMSDKRCVDALVLKYTGLCSLLPQQARIWPTVPCIWNYVIYLGKICSCTCAVISSDVKTRWQPCEDCLLAFSFICMANEPLKDRYVKSGRDADNTNSYKLQEILPVSWQLQTWRRCEFFRLYL